MAIELPPRVFISTAPGSERVRLEQDLVITVDGNVITCRAGQDADGNTVPWVFTFILPRYGWALEAGIVHDNLPRSVAADTIHRKLVIELGKRGKVWFPRTRAWIVWCILALTVVTGLRALAIRLFGA